MRKLTIFSNLVTINYARINAVCPSYCDTTMDLYMQAHELIRSVLSCRIFFAFHFSGENAPLHSSSPSYATD